MGSLERMARISLKLRIEKVEIYNDLVYDIVIYVIEIDPTFIGFVKCLAYFYLRIFNVGRISSFWLYLGAFRFSKL